MAETPKTLGRKRSEPAYVFVDIDSLDPELKADIVEDALAGGGLYGIRIVEEAVNGPARAPIYGYYKDGPDAERWAAAKKELKLDDSAEHVDEASLRESAAKAAASEAKKQRKAEDADIAEITGEDKKTK